MQRPLLIFSQSDYLILIVDKNPHIQWQTSQIQISWLLQKPTDLDLRYLQKQGISGFNRTRVNPSPAEPRYALPLQTLDPDQLTSSVGIFFFFFFFFGICM